MLKMAIPVLHVSSSAVAEEFYCARLGFRRSKGGEAKMRRMTLVFAAWLLIPCAAAAIQQSTNEPSGNSGYSKAAHPMQDAHSQMNERGEKGMGFSQTATTHHFVLTSNGGVIQVEVNDPADTADLNRIRMHLAHIAQAFAKGDFDIPMFVHDTVPAGVPEMKRLRKKIHYSYEDSLKGGRVVVASSDKKAIEAIHKFLRFQIEEHKTGDPTQAQ
jgi:hypothetical protein